MIYETINKIFQFNYPNESLSESKTEISQMLKMIENADPQIARLLVNLRRCYESYHFVKQDIELRSKVKDIWIIQVERTKSELQNCIIKYNELAHSHQTDPLNQEDWL
jgi:hypothetical protein